MVGDLGRVCWALEGAGTELSAEVDNPKVWIVSGICLRWRYGRQARPAGLLQSGLIAVYCFG